jgi:tetratricopeptide (TPR) repeat protein
MFLGYEPVWQDVFGTETGDLRAVLRQKIDHCKGVVQLVGCCYGAEPPTVDGEFGRVSYTQYEAMYARLRSKKVWYLFIDEHFPVDPCEDEPPELHGLQNVYRRRLQSDAHVFHPLATIEGLEASVLKLRDDLVGLRRGMKQWAAGIAALLILTAGLVAWQLHGQAQMKAEISKLRQGVMEYPKIEAQIRGSQTDSNPVAVQEQVYAELGKQLSVDPRILRERLPQFAAALRSAPNTSVYERANAAYVAKDYPESERLALQAAEDARQVVPGRTRKIRQALELAGLSAHRQIQYSRAMEHFSEAEKLTDPERDLDEWVTLEHEVADLLVADGKYADAESLFRKIIQRRSTTLGPDHPDTLDSCHRLVYALSRQTKYAEAEAVARRVLKLRERVLGPEHVDTLVSRYNLGECLVDQGKYAEAETLYRDVIRENEKVLGSEDPRTLAARVGLATVLGSQGKNAEAEPLYREIIQLDQKIYGPEHPYTLNDRQNFANALGDDGKYAEAEQQYRDVIRMDENLVGSKHPDTLICRNNLAEMLDDEGKYAEAEIECRRIIPIVKDLLGPENRLTLNTRGNLAVALIAQGKFPEAETEYKNVIVQMEHVLGLEHPDTISYATKFANALVIKAKADQARQLAQQLQDHALQLLGHGNGSSNASLQQYLSLLQSLKSREQETAGR